MNAGVCLGPFSHTWQTSERWTVSRTILTHDRVPIPWRPPFCRLVAARQRVRALTLKQAVSMIRKECDPAFLIAVRESGGQFLYRGEQLPATAALLALPPDLLELDTYASSAAVHYFQNLESGLRRGRLFSVARPSSGHIAVARSEAAALWGPSVSVCACTAHPPTLSIAHAPFAQVVSHKWPRTDGLVHGLTHALGSRALRAARQAYPLRLAQGTRRLLARWGGGRGGGQL